MTTEGTFDKGILRLFATADRTFGMAEIEPELIHLLSSMEHSGKARSAIVATLIALINQRDEYPRLGRPGLLELLEFSMHKLRWPEIRDALSAIDTPSSYLHERELARRVLDAYNDDWSNADIYDTYRID